MSEQIQTTNIIDAAQALQSAAEELPKLKKADLLEFTDQALNIIRALTNKVEEQGEELTEQYQVQELGNPRQVSQFAKVLSKFIEEQGLSTEIGKGSRKFVGVDGWKFAGLNFGLSCIPDEPKRIDENEELTEISRMVKARGKNGGTWEKFQRVITSNAKEINNQVAAWASDEATIGQPETRKYNRIAYQCRARIVRMSDGVEVGQGFAICGNEEDAKSNFDQYAIFSMAQTRAISKAYRNVIGFVMIAAGYSDTPAEEMEEKYTRTEQKKADVFTDELKAKIESFTDAFELLEWASNAGPVNQDKQFRLAVTAKRKQLEA